MQTMATQLITHYYERLYSSRNALFLARRKAKDIAKTEKYRYLLARVGRKMSSMNYDSSEEDEEEELAQQPPETFAQYLKRMKAPCEIHDMLELELQATALWPEAKSLAGKFGCVASSLSVSEHPQYTKDMEVKVKRRKLLVLICEFLNGIKFDLEWDWENKENMWKSQKQEVYAKMKEWKTTQVTS